MMEMYSMKYGTSATGWVVKLVMDIKGGNPGTDNFGNAGSGGSADTKY